MVRSTSDLLASVADAISSIAALAAIDAPGLKVAFSEGWIRPFTRKKRRAAAKFYVHSASRPNRI